MTAKGKINASKVQANDRVLIQTNPKAYGIHQTHNECLPSGTKTGEGVVVARVLDKAKCSNRRGYMVFTNEGSFYAEPMQTMWLAPEDNAGIKRAHAEALAEDVRREVEAEVMDKYHAEALAEDEERTEKAKRQELADEIPAAQEIEEAPEATPAAQEDDECDAKGCDIPEGLGECVRCGAELLVEYDGDDDDAIDTPAAQETTGSAVVKLLERVHGRIRQNHPEVPEMVIVTGAGIGMGNSKWGHFRPNGWVSPDNTPRHEMFMAGETLAKGSAQVLQTMLHESAHALSEVRGQKDTSRQGRWHNKTFVKAAEEVGLEYTPTAADKSTGYSAVTLRQETRDEYADLLAELDAEIGLTVKLPVWLGGDAGEGGGESMGRAPQGAGTKSTSTQIKLTCECEEPNIIRASRKVADRMVVHCSDCDALFRER